MRLIMSDVYTKTLRKLVIIVSIFFLMLLNGSTSKRERVFFICIRHDLGVHFLKVSDLFNVEPYIDMEFNESEIYYGEYADYKGKPIGVKMRKLFEQRVAGDIALAEAYKKQTGKRGFLINNIYMRTK